MFAKWSCHQRGSPLDKPTAAQTVKDVEEDCFLPCPANISSTATHFSDFDGQTATLLLLLLTKKDLPDVLYWFTMHFSIWNLEIHWNTLYYFRIHSITLCYFWIHSITFCYFLIHLIAFCCFWIHSNTFCYEFGYICKK